MKRTISLLLIGFCTMSVSQDRDVDLDQKKDMKEVKQRNLERAKFKIERAIYRLRRITGKR